ncbi:competence type IV pilus major pilin ComGC [Tepidibacillus sp. LV47]|uniref:competence type IV pilus major pilin ComGC n=1 Tax=Tepidibacillus sp. LV47 TaxID=3398228 RepID=UPI003AAAE2B8
MNRNLFRKQLSNQRGVTLIELLAVIVILGIIAAVAVPVVLNQIDTAKKNAGEADKAIVLDAAQRYFIQHSSDANPPDSVAVSTLVSEGFLKEKPKGYTGPDPITKDDLTTTTN